MKKDTKENLKFSVGILIAFFLFPVIAILFLKWGAFLADILLY